MTLDDPFFSIDQLPVYHPRPGTERRSLRFGDLVMLFISFEQPTAAPVHQHDYPSVILADIGDLEVRVGDDVRRLRPGEGATIPAGVPHGLTTLEPGVRVLELWYPVPDGQ